MKRKNIIILDDNCVDLASSMKLDNNLSSLTQHDFAMADFIFAKEVQKYRIFKNRYGNNDICLKQDIIKYIFS